MQHLIFGTGLIGSYLAGCFLHSGWQVRFEGRPNRTRALESGFNIRDYSGNQKAITHSPTHNDDPIDYLWLTIKCISLEEALPRITELLSPNTVIVACQNGIGSDQIIREAFPNQHILQAMIGFNVIESKTNTDISTFLRATEGSFVIEHQEHLASTFKSIDETVLPFRFSNNIEAEQWAKLQFNLANAVCALGDVPIKSMFEDPSYRRLIGDLMRELLAVTKAKRLHLPQLSTLPPSWLPSIFALPNFLYLPLARKTTSIDPEARMSMWWDISQGKKTEINFLNQAVVDAGEKLGVDCPMNAQISELIRQVECKQLEIGINGRELRYLIKNEKV